MQEFRTLRTVCYGPWAIMGDFNLIYRLAGKNNDNIDQAIMGRFRKMLSDLELCEIDLLGRQFTWSNERSAPTLVRLDRVFCSHDWENLLSNCLLQSTAASISDHCPLLLGLNSLVQGKK